jgi:hypothetical protein
MTTDRPRLMVLRHAEWGQYQIKKGALATVPGPKGEAIWQREEAYLFDATEATRRQVEDALDGLGFTLYPTKAAVQQELKYIETLFGIKLTLRKPAGNDDE